MILDAIFAKNDDRQSDLLRGDRGWDSFSGGELPTSTTAGVRIDECSSMAFPAVWAAVTILAELLASLPCHTYRRRPDNGRDRDRNHQLYDVLHLRANPFMSAFTFWETLEGHRLLWGNAFAEIAYDQAGRIVALWPIIPDRIKIDQSGDGYVYRVTNPDATEVVIPSFKMLHIVGFSPDGILGSSPIRVNRDTIGGAMASEQFSGQFFAHGVTPSGILVWPGIEEKDKAKRAAARKVFEQDYGGVSRSHRVLMMSEAGDWKAIGTDPEKSQLLETRKYGINQMSRVFHIPGFMLGDNEAMKWRNVEQLSLLFERYSMRPTAERYEQEINWKLFPGPERMTHFAEFDLDGLLRADLQARTESYFRGFQIGHWTINEMLQRENRNPIGPAGDVRFVPLNLAPIDKVISGEAGQGAGPSQRQIDAEHELIETLVTRAIEKERHELCKARVRLSEKGDRAWFDRWVTKFYREHEQRVLDAMLPGLKMAAISRDISIAVICNWAKVRTGKYIGHSLARARDLTYDPAGLSPSIEAAAIYDAFVTELSNADSGESEESV